MSVGKKKSAISWSNCLLYGAVTLVCIVGLFGFVVLNFGFVRGSQFNPFSFSERSFSYVRLPPTSIQISPVTYSPTNTGLTDYIAKNRILSTVNQPSQPLWHVTMVFTGSESQSGDAKILTDFLLEKSDDDELFWLKWSKDHPELAKVFWPLVSEVGQNEAYMIIPELFEAAKNLNNKKDLFKPRITSKLAESYASLASDYQRSSEFEKAINLYTLALKYNSESMAKYYRNRAKCFAAIGESEKAAKDEGLFRQQRDNAN